MHVSEITMDGLLRALGASSAFALVGIVVFLVAFFAMTSLLPFSVRKEIEEDHNTALAILMAYALMVPEGYSSGPAFGMWLPEFRSITFVGFMLGLAGAMLCGGAPPTWTGLARRLR